MPKQPDPPELIASLRARGATIRLRKSGQVHTLDFSAADEKPTDQQLRELTTLQNLEVLNLTDAPITDASVELLREHSGLKLLTLMGTQMSATAIKQLRQNLIGCRIVG